MLKILLWIFFVCTVRTSGLQSFQNDCFLPRLALADVACCKLTNVRDERAYNFGLCGESPGCPDLHGSSESTSIGIAVVSVCNPTAPGSRL